MKTAMVLAVCGLTSLAGCKGADKDQLAATREAVVEANAIVQADPAASPKMKDATKKAAEVVSAGVTESGEVDWIGAATTAGGYLPAPYNLFAALGVGVLGTWLKTRKKSAPAAGGQ